MLLNNNLNRQTNHCPILKSLDIVEIEDLTRVVISYEIYESSLR